MNHEHTVGVNRETAALALLAAEEGARRKKLSPQVEQPAWLRKSLEAEVEGQRWL